MSPASRLQPIPVALVGSQAVPIVVAPIWQVPIVPLASSAPMQTRPDPHGAPLPHEAPDAARATHVDVSEVQVRPGPHVVRAAHDAPAWGAAWQTPHADAGAMAQKPLWHWPGNAHAAFAASCPFCCWHEEGMFASLR